MRVIVVSSAWQDVVVPVAASKANIFDFFIVFVGSCVVREKIRCTRVRTVDRIDYDGEGEGEGEGKQNK
jgi:hypothetical protein